MEIKYTYLLTIMRLQCNCMLFSFIENFCYIAQLQMSYGIDSIKSSVLMRRVKALDRNLS